MRSGHTRSLVGVGLAALLGLAASGCGGTSSPSTTTTAKPTTTTTAPATPPKTTAAVTATWTKFFAYSTTEATRLSLLQDGSKYASVITSLTKLLPAGAMATVQGVTSDGPTTATVAYTLKDSTGTVFTGDGKVVEVGGKWLVSSTTFCALIDLAGATCPA